MQNRFFLFPKQTELLSCLWYVGKRLIYLQFILMYQFLFCLGFSSWGESIPAIQVGQTVNVVPFGEIIRWDDNGNEYGVIWEDPRDIFQVDITFKPGIQPPDPNSLRLEYWQSSWPERRIPRDQPSGSGSSGWLDIGDWHKGKWQKADTILKVNGLQYTFTFKPINAEEFPKFENFDAAYRTTLKLRIVPETPLPPIETFSAFTDSTWKLLEAEVEWGGNAKENQVRDGRVEIFNGHLQDISTLPSSAVLINPDRSWKSQVQGKTDGIRLKILYSHTQGFNSFDETVVTIRTQSDPFSFAASDLLKWKHIFIPDYGVLVRLAGEKVTYNAAEQEWKQNPNKDLYTRVKELPEQTLTQAWNDTPPKDPHYIPLSFEGGRQHFGLDEHGNVFCIKNWITNIPGKDTEHCLWEGNEIHYRFGLPETRPVERHLVDGYLPMIETTWEAEGIRYRQSAFVVPLNGVPTPGSRIWADDPLVLLMKIEMSLMGNIGDGESRNAEPAIAISDKDGDEEFSIEGDKIISERNGIKRLRMMISAANRIPNPDLDLYIELNANQPKETLEIKIPYITLTEEKEWAQLRKLAFDKEFENVRNYWQSRIKTGAQITTPEPDINDFYKAHVSHLLINTEREVGLSDRYMAKVGTFHYGVFSNESCMMVSDLDRRGYHQRAEEALETWLHYQGTVGLPGDFSSQAGEFYGAGGYEHGGYNQHHGWVLWCMGEHYWYTRDSAWLKHAAPYLVKACDWIIKERRRTMETAKKSPLRAIEYGLLPQGSLEDIGDWRSWLSTNVYSWWGMQNAAAALAAENQADGQRLMQEAEAYRQDILAAFTEAMRRSPVVRLRDGSWIPNIPSDVHRRGRTFGWLTVTLEGGIHIVRCGMIEPWDRLSTWIIKDFEDNLYLSEQYGYNLTGKEFDRFWFSRGGISQQANLLCNPIPYLQRDEPKHFLRAYFNAFTTSFFPDTRMMTEHALPNIGDWRGDHYKSSDEANSTYWLRLMFIEERGDTLRLGAAIPRYWLAERKPISIENAATYFGTWSMKMESSLRRGRGGITMSIEPSKRNRPKTIRAFFRHPDQRKMTKCEVNGIEYKNFNPEEEWVELSAWVGKTQITAYYE